MSARLWHSLRRHTITTLTHVDLTTDPTSKWRGWVCECGARRERKVSP